VFSVVAVAVVAAAVVVAVETAIGFVTAALLTDEQRKHLILTKATLVVDVESLEHHQPEAASGFARDNGFPSTFDLEEIVSPTEGFDFLGQKYSLTELFDWSISGQVGSF